MDLSKVKRINFALIGQQRTRPQKEQTLLEEIARCDNEIIITDCLVNKGNGGLDIMHYITQTEKQMPMRRFKIKVLKDMWGKPVQPGDKVEWVRNRKTRTPFGVKMRHAHIASMISQGREREVIDFGEATVDNKGCIDVGFFDAGMLLNTRGVFLNNPKIPLTQYKETSTKPSHNNQADKFQLQHFWLYQEVPMAIYNELPDLTKAKDKSTVKSESSNK